jgi:hypothetical protein
VSVAFDNHADRLERTASIPTISALTVTWWGLLTGASSVNRCAFGIVNSGSSTNHIQVQVDGSELLHIQRDNNTWSGAGGTITQDVWYRYALVINGTTPTLYWGAHGSALSSAAGDSLDAPAVTSPKFVFGSNLNFSRFWGGWLANFKIHPSVLSAAQVEKALQTTWPEGVAAVDAHYPLLDIGTKLVDYGGGALDLTAPGGGTWETKQHAPIPWRRARSRVFVPAGGNGAGFKGLFDFIGYPVGAGSSGAVLEASVAASVTATSAALTTQITPAAAVTAQVTPSAALTTSIACAATATASVTASASLTTQIRLAAAVSATVNATTATLTTAIALAASVSATVNAVGELSGPAILQAAVSATVTAAGALTTSIACAATASATVAASASLTTSITPAAAVAASVSVSAASLTTQIRPAASVSATVNAAAALTTQIRLAAAVSSTVTVSNANLIVDAGLMASGTAQVTSSANLSTSIACAASAGASVSVSGSLSTAIALAASVSATVSLLGELFTPGPSPSAFAIDDARHGLLVDGSRHSFEADASHSFEVTDG